MITDLVAALRVQVPSLTQEARKAVSATLGLRGLEPMGDACDQQGWLLIRAAASGENHWQSE